MAGRPSKLTPEQVRAIREWWAVYSTIPTAAKLAKQLGVHRTTVEGIARKLWYKRETA